MTNADQQQHIKSARDTARTLVRTLLQSLSQATEDSQEARAPDDDLLAALVLYAGILVRGSDDEAGYVRDHVADTPESVTPADLLSAIDARVPPPCLAFKIVERYVRKQSSLSGRSHYNTACFYSGLGGSGGKNSEACLDRALLELDLGLADASLVSWAKEDPSLRPLAESRPADWSAVLARHDPSAAPQASAPEMFDPLAASLAAFVAGYPNASAVRPGTDVDFEVETPAGVVLVKTVTTDPVTTDDVQALLAAVTLWASPSETLAGKILLMAPDLTITPDALVLASRGTVNVKRLSGRGIIETVAA